MKNDLNDHRQRGFDAFCQENYPQTLHHLTKALTILEKRTQGSARLAFEQAELYLPLGQTHMLTGQPRQAQECLTKALEGLAIAGQTQGPEAMIAMGHLAGLYLQGKEVDKAHQLLDKVEAVLSDGYDPPYPSRLDMEEQLLLRAACHWKEGSLQKARENYQEVLRWSQEHQRPLYPSLHHHLGIIALLQHQWQEAIHHLKTSLEGKKHTLYFDGILSLMEYPDLAMAYEKVGDQDSAEATYQEGARRAYDLMAALPQAQDQLHLYFYGLKASETILARWAGSREEPETPDSCRPSSQLQSHLAVFKGLVHTHTAGGTLLLPEPETLRSHLPANTLMMDYHLVRPRTLDETALQEPPEAPYLVLSLFTSQGHHQLLKIPRAETLRDQLDTLIQAWRDKEEALYHETAKELYQHLVAPALQLYREETGAEPDKLVILPDDFLWDLPFDLLENHQHQLVLETQTTIYLESPHDLVKEPPSQKQPTKALLLWDQSQAPLLHHDVKYPPAQAIRREAFQVRSQLSKKDCQLTELSPSVEDAALTQALSQADLVHRAGHGFSFQTDFLNRYAHRPPGEVWTLSDLDTVGMLMAKEEEGATHIWEIMSRHFLSVPLKARLVFLSGCQTAMGETPLKEPPYSLANLFSHAGARQVVATLQPVTDRHAQQIAAAFYHGYLAGGSAIDSLKEAMKQQLEDQRRQAHTHRVIPGTWGFYRVLGMD
ncbi:CHAT domain-containing tetratricopeptide repeat protein [Anoxynatronum sibiricum]|uniref:CHAT domain-containing tetratricopeptide repeat protein n=1 Tax=Anoxynatronum sibiricum TaxID=210623 RepID=A0ABU9VT56_9CLOT